MAEDTVNGRPATFLQAILTFAVLAASLIITTSQFDGSPHVPLLFSAAVAAAVGLFNRVPWSGTLDSIASAFSDASAAIIVMLLIGVIIAT